MSFFEEVLAALPKTDRSGEFKGDRLLAVSPDETLQYAQKIISPEQLQKIIFAKMTPNENFAEIDTDWRSRADGFTLRFRITVKPPATLAPSLEDACEQWCSGDSVTIVRYRKHKIIRMAVVERTSKECARVKMYFGPPHTAWSDTDETMYQLGIREIEANVTDPKLTRALSSMPGHRLFGKTLIIDYPKFRTSKPTARIGKSRN